MTMTMNEPVPASLQWMQSYDPMHAVSDDLTPEECVSVINCMVRERSIRECCELTGLSRPAVAFWYEQLENITRTMPFGNGRKGEGSACRQADPEND